MECILGIVCFLIAIVAVAWVQSSFLSEKQVEISTALQSLNNFSVTQVVVSEDGKTGLAIDENKKKLCFANCLNGKVSLDEIGYQDILASEIVENGETVTKTSRGSQVAGAVIGGLVFGGIGAVVGGLSGNTKSSSRIRTLDLQVTVKNVRTPIRVINFLNHETNKNSVHYTSALKAATHWHGIISVLLKEIEVEKDGSIGKAVSISVSDELLKLDQLREKGILSQEEFIAQKKKLLS